MPSRKKNSQNAVQSRILFDVLAVIGRPASLADLKNVLLLLGHGDFEVFSRMSEGEIGALLEPLLASGELQKQTSDGTFYTQPLASEKLREILSRPEYSILPDAVSRALPSVGAHGATDGENLRRDIRNAFYSANTAFLNQVLVTMRDSFPKEYNNSNYFDFLFQEDEEWLLALPDSFLTVCAWKLLPSATLSLRAVRSLAEKCYSLSESAMPMAISAMLDYAILCGDWNVVPNLLKRLPQGRAPRMTRVAWLRFITGRDEESINYFRDALELIRRDAHAHDGYFRTISGIFGVLALLREGSSASLQLAQAYAKAGMRDDTTHRVVYTLLDQVVQAKANPDLPPFHPVWHSEERLNNVFSCLAHYWLTGSLDGGQQLLLESAASAAHAGGYDWLAEECDEFLQRLRSQSVGCNRWHEGQTGKMPFMLDCVLTRNSWVDRLDKLGRTLKELPSRTSTRLAWFVNTEQADRGIITVKPIEQHITRSGKWTKGRRFTGYRVHDYRNVLPSPPEQSEDIFSVEMTPQDKYACDVLREAEEMMKLHPDFQQRAWNHVLEALIGHPRLFLDGGENRTLRCIGVEPVIQVTRADEALQYALLPESKASDDCIVRLERGDQICVYQFSPAMKHLREILSGDFRIPDESSSENRAVLEQMIQHFRIISDEPLQGVNLPECETDSMPHLQLIPRERGLNVELMVRPFGQEGQYYQPGEGPREMIFQDRDVPRRMIRDFAQEIVKADELVASCQRLAATALVSPWHWSLEGMACYELTLQLRELMDKCHIQWPADQKFVCHRTLSMSNISLHTQSYLSWFSVSGEVHLEDSDGTASLAELIQAVSERKHFISLSDGQVVALSESLRKRLEDLSRLGEIVRGRAGGGHKLQVCRFLMPFLNDSLSEFPGAELPPEAGQWIQRYDNAMKLVPPVPDALQAKLRPYQEEGFLWMSRLDSAEAGACLADDMGLGKTIQAITLILSKAADGPALIVAPTSVCANWHAEFQKFAPSLHCEIFGPGDRNESFKKLGPQHVLITSYGLLQSEQQAFRKIQWRVAVLDEAQAIKNAHAKRSQAALEIHADFRIVTTGTPVENNLSELWSIFNFIIPGLLGSRENFQHRFATAIEHDNNQDVAKNLRGIVSPFLLRRSKDQVLNELPPKEEIDYAVELSAEERQFYDNLRRQILADLDSHDESDGQRHIRVLAGITKLRLAVDHPRLVAGGENLPGAKLEAFLELLRRILRNGHKVLVFSQFVKFLEIVRETLDSEEIRYEYLDGARTPKERAVSVENFQKGDVPVFLISLKAGGLGLNLTQADYVIHLDSWWNPAVENQASDRAHRLGQNKKVTIYHLQTANTIEDKIKALHKRKRDLADALLSEADTIETTPLEELLKLLREG